MNYCGKSTPKYSGVNAPNVFSFPPWVCVWDKWTESACRQAAVCCHLKHVPPLFNTLLPTFWALFPGSMCSLFPLGVCMSAFEFDMLLKAVILLFLVSCTFNKWNMIDRFMSIALSVYWVQCTPPKNDNYDWIKTVWPYLNTHVAMFAALLTAYQYTLLLN